MKTRLEELCKHNPYCVKKRELNFPEPCRTDYAIECGQTKRFYDRYGENFNESEFFGRREG